MIKGEYYLKLATHYINMKEIWAKKLGTKDDKLAKIEIEKWQQQLESLVFENINQIKILDKNAIWNFKVSNLK